MSQVSGNTGGRLFAIGDIHGCDQPFDLLLNELAPTKADTVVLLGDIVDRGPNSARVIDMVTHLLDETNLVFIRGNHEEMMLEALRKGDLKRSDWMHYGGKQVIESYGGSIGNIPPWHLDLINNSVDYFATEYSIFVHANLEPGVLLESQCAHWLRWEKLVGDEPPWPDGRTVYCGHTIQADGPYVHNGWVCLDTGAYRGGFLTALEVHSQICTMASKKGLMKNIPLEQFKV